MLATAGGTVQDVVAIKFFTDPAGFANEERAYSIKAVAEAVGSLPVFMRNENSAAVMPSGWPFPPFTVSEKGQPLDVWMRGYSADLVTSMQARTHAVSRMLLERRNDCMHSM
ncbi:MAG: hypothetical protein HC767_01040 [Akkermansiaceae bacterium]|nr:hypothetical protein [Akkermansiaceae bacterium]